jgi:FkbM family methyltransferase
MQKIKNYIKEHPLLYDNLIKLKRYLGLGVKSQIFSALDDFSKSHKRRIKFIQIGANDGLRNDPIREFIIRDNWSGLLVEPLPYAFNELKRNYSGYHHKHLSFLNAAISTHSLNFWTFNSGYLDSLSKEDRMDHLRKSSFSKEHLYNFFGNNPDFDQIINSIPVKSLTFKQLVVEYWDHSNINLLVIDAEGHEKNILTCMINSDIHPDAILYEQHNLDSESEIVTLLIQYGYKVENLGGDAFAILQ